MPTATRTVEQHELVSPEEQMRELKRNFLLCRSFGHKWDPVMGADNIFEVTERNARKQITEMVIQLRCTRCHSTDTKVFDGNTNRIGDRRWYPEGYLLKHGASRAWRHHAVNELYLRQRA